MTCPRCVQKIHARAIECPHCGFSLTNADEAFGSDEIKIHRLSDVAGVLKRKERRELVKQLDRFEKNFPQLFFAVHIAALEPLTDVRQYGLWLLNRGSFEDLAEHKTNAGCVVLVLDVSAKTASLSFGYILDDALDQEDSFSILSKAHPFLLQGQYLRGVEVILAQLRGVLARRSRASRSIDPKTLEATDKQDSDDEDTEPVPENGVSEVEDGDNDVPGKEAEEEAAV